MKRFILATVFAAFGSTMALPQESTLWKHEGNWSIYIDQSLENACYAAIVYEDHTIVRIGFPGSDASASIYMTLANENWQSLEEGKEYDLVFQIDDQDPWNGVATAIGTGDFPTLLLGIDKIDFIDELMRRHTLRISFRNRVILMLSLKGSHAAISEMVACQAWTSENAPDSSPSDPFTGVSEETTKDPFAL